MMKPISMRLLSAKLLALGKTKTTCTICFGAGYAWINSHGYFIPILCKCMNRNKDVYVRGNASGESLTRTEGGKKEEIVFAIPLRDVIIDYKSLGKISKDLEKIAAQEARRREIIDCQVDENYSDVLTCIVDRALDANFNQADLTNLVKMLESNVDESGNSRTS